MIKRSMIVRHFRYIFLVRFGLSFVFTLVSLVEIACKSTISSSIEHIHREIHYCLYYLYKMSNLLTGIKRVDRKKRERETQSERKQRSGNICVCKSNYRAFIQRTTPCVFFIERFFIFRCSNEVTATTYS